MEELEGRQIALNRNNFPNARYKKFYINAINHLKKEIAFRKNENRARAKQATHRMANKARTQASAKRHLSVARKVINKWKAAAWRPPTRGGVSYERLLRQTRVGRSLKKANGNN